MSPSSESASSSDAEKLEWQTLLRHYLLVYLLATLSDWLQGPYVYALYSDYGYSQHEIAVLFVAGFGSSMIFGSFVGGMADWGGRRAFVVVFSIVYAASCMTKHFKNFKILMLGRLLGGVATSLLFSVFEAWLIRSHADHKLKSFLGKSFSWAAYGNSIIAIVAGLVANKAASMSKMTAIVDNYFYVGGYLTPFDIALVCLVICGGCAVTLWEENYGSAGGPSPAMERMESGNGESDTEGDRKESGSHGGRDGPKWHDGLKTAFIVTIRNTDILLCGIISSLFEGSMYIFVFMWTPALTQVSDRAGKGGLPFGVIFSTFMVCCMAGSSLFSISMDKLPGERLAVFIFGAGSLAMACIAFAGSETIKFLGMNIFEICVGMYWPCMGTLKGVIVPESKRAAIYNLYRIPLNFIVLFSLLTDLTPTQSFFLNSVMLAVATALQFVLMKRREAVTSSLEQMTETVKLISEKGEESVV